MKRKAAIATLVVLLVSTVVGNTTKRLEVEAAQNVTSETVTETLSETENHKSTNKQESEIYVFVEGKFDEPIIAECEKRDSGYWSYVFERDDYDLFASDMQINGANLYYDIAIADDLEVYLRFKNKDTTDAANVIATINAGNNALNGSNNWLLMVLNGLKLNEYNQIMEQINEAGKELGYQICTTVKEDDSFTVAIEMTSYQVVEGDTLSEIAEKKWTTVESLMELNPQIVNPDLIYCGDVLKLK